MAIKINLSSAPYVIPSSDGIVGVPLPEANALLGVNQAATDWQGWLLQAGSNVEIVHDDNARTITLNATSGSATTVSAGTGISVSHVGNDYAVSSTIQQITVSAGTGMSVSHVGNDYAVSTTHPTVSAGTNVTVSHVGNDYTVSASGVQTIMAGTNISVSRVGDAVTVNNTASPITVSAGTNVSVAHVGDNYAVSATGVQSIVAGTNVTVSRVGDTVTVNATGSSGTTYSPTATKGTGISASGTVGIDVISSDGKSFRLAIDTNSLGSNGTYVVINMGATPPSGSWKVSMMPASSAAVTAMGSMYVTHQTGSTWSPQFPSGLPASTHLEWLVQIHD